MSKVDISVIICCYNSEQLIKDTLRYLSKQQLKSSLVFEVVLVDNNSTDNTVVIAKDLWNRLKPEIPLKVVSEKVPGLSHARKTGVLASRGEIIVFCDDDNWLQSDYLNIAFEIMKANPAIGALGGQSKGVLEVEEPSWWQNKQSDYAVGKQAAIDGDISKKGFVWGAGIVVKRENMISLYEAGLKPLVLGRTGKVQSSGDDSEICKWMLLLGYRLWYSDKLQFIHYIQRERLTKMYLEKLLKGHADSQNILSVYDWFINNHIYQFLENFTFRKRYFVLKKIIRYFIKGKKQWKYYLQIIVGTNIKVSSSVYYISRTLKNLKM